ncbi:long-chain-fatty-acid--CoA ligase [Mycobacteriaceae bacterium NPDC060252]
MQMTMALHRAVQLYPDRPATIFGERGCSYRESFDRVARLASALRSLGIGSGDRVALLAFNSDRYHEYLLAVPWSGAVVVPVNIRWSHSEIAYSLRESDARILLVDDAFAPMAATLRAECPGITEVVFCGDAERPAGLRDYEELIDGASPMEDARRSGDDLYGVFYTGGTTGLPKGVMLSHKNVLSSSTGAIVAGDLATRAGRTLHAAPLFHLAGIASWSMGLLLGSTHAFVPGFTPAGVAKAIERHAITDVLLVPTMIQMLIDSPDAAGLDLTSLRRLLYGASVISEAVLDRAAKALPGVGFVQAYGMTELAPAVSLLMPEDHDQRHLRRSAGRAIAHVEVRIVDPVGQQVPRGEVGEITARGDGVMLGYWKRPEDTATAIRDGWMHTGDAGYMDEAGFIYVVDRIKDMIITGGENVFSAEVENALSEHERVATCAVIGVPDTRWGERVHAVVVLKPGIAVAPAELTEFCRGRIANYKVPRSISFTDSMPLSGAGKVLKRELRQQFVETHTEQSGISSGAASPTRIG